MDNLVKSEYKDGSRYIEIKRKYANEDGEEFDVMVVKDKDGVRMAIATQDDFYCNNTIEEIKTLRNNIDLAIKIANNFEKYWNRI